MENQDRALWLQQRKRGIGGSDAAAILGLSKWGTAYDVWLEKTGQMPPEEPRATVTPMWWGTEMEDLIARAYCHITGKRVWNPDTMMVHPDHPILIGTPDRFVLGEDRGLEIKRVGFRSAHLWGQPGTDDVPENYAIQCHHYMMVTGKAAWDLAALIGDYDVQIYTLRRDPEFEGWLKTLLLDWWERHVVGMEPPDITGAQSTENALARRFQRSQPTLLSPTTEVEVLMENLATVRALMQKAEVEEREYQNALKAFLGEAEGVDGGKFMVRWKSSKDTESVDWKAVAQALMDGGHVPQDVYLNTLHEQTKQKPGSRRFTIKQVKDLACAPTVCHGELWPGSV